MLSRTADNLFWLSRYVERADYLARVLEAASRLSALPKAYGSGTNEWESAVATAGCTELFHRFHEASDASNVIHFLAFSEDNPSSIKSCLEVARTNARAVRTAITTEMWETINSAWLDLNQMSARATDPDSLMVFIDWVKEISLRFDGSGYRTMLRNDAYWFARLGIFIERADNTARILDVKYHVLRPHGDEGATDFYQWGALLRSVSAFEVYRKAYRDVITPERVAELLILRSDMPRSLHFCLNGVVKNLELIANRQSGETHRQAGLLHAQLHYARIEDILERGLHEFLTDFMDRIYTLGDGVSKDFLVPMAEAA